MALNELGRVWITELLFAIDVETLTIVDASGDLASGFGVDPRDMIGRPIMSTFEHDDPGGVRDALEEVLANGRATWEGEIWTPDSGKIGYAWEGRLGASGKTIFTRGRDGSRVRAALADIRIYERLADLTADGFLVLDAAGRIIEANRAAVETLACPREDFLGKDLGVFVRSDGQGAFERSRQPLEQGERQLRAQLPIVAGDGREVVVEGSATFDEITDRWYIVARDVTKRVSREHDLEVTQRFFELSASQLLMVGSDDCILRANPAFEAAVGRSLNELVGMSVAEAFGALDTDWFLAVLDDVRQAGSSDRYEVAVDRGGPGTLDVHVSPASEAGSVYLSCHDVTEERELRNELFTRATRDGLTGLINRATLVEEIGRELESGTVTTVLMLDLDGFKQVNDSLGHAAGDELLVRVAERLGRQTRAVDVVCRYGGDEFAILLRGVPDAPTAVLVAEKVRKAFHEPFEVQGRIVEMSASVGAAVGARTTHDTEQLVSEADLAAYACKQAGGDRACAFDENLQAANDFAAAVEGHLRRVLRSPTFDLDVIPFADLDGVIRGVGVTAPAIAISGQRRWNTDSMKVAKRLGLLGPLANRLATATISGLASWLRTHGDSYLDFVVDVVELDAPAMADHMLGLLRDHRIAPEQLIISIAGVGGIGINEGNLAVIRQLRAAGVRISFAASRADTDTLAALHLGCIDRIDVDTAHVSVAPEGSVDRLIASTVFDVADRLGVEVVVDASFTPDVVDAVSVFRTCSPVGLVSGAAVPLDDFVSGGVGMVLPD